MERLLSIHENIRMLILCLHLLNAFYFCIYTGSIFGKRDRVLRVETPAEEDWPRLWSMLEAELPPQDIDVWRAPAHDRKSADVYVKGCHLEGFKKRLQDGGLKWSVMIDDVSGYVRRQQQQIKRSKRASSSNNKGRVVGQFVRHREIEAWLKKMAATHSNVTTLYNIGQSYEGRPMHVLKVGWGSGYQRSVWVDAGLHAREWVAPASAIYLIHKLLKNYQTDPEIKRYVTELSWYFLVVANPDGYEYTFTKYRFWRKNRRPLPFNCTGVDLNRNFRYMWGGADASPNPCNVVYRGPRPESEPEVQNMVRFLMPRRQTFVVYMSLHSYGQKLLGRWAYTNETRPDDHKEQEALAQRAVRAMTRQHQRHYETGTAAYLMYPYSGGSADWAQGWAGIKYSYVTELRDEGVYGFLLPPEEVIPTGQEIWAGIRVFLRYITNSQSWKRSATTSTSKISTVIPDDSGSFSSSFAQSDSPSQTQLLTASAFPMSNSSVKSFLVYPSSGTTSGTGGLGSSRVWNCCSVTLWVVLVMLSLDFSSSVSCRISIAVMRV